jgi:hypothetical protein
MMPASLPLTQACAGESLVAGLCREMDRLRRRAAQVADQQRCTQDPQLFERLRQEWRQLAARRAELQRVAAWLARQGQLGDGLALAFLAELTQRPLAQA